ncbi:hypothetical protein EAX61_15280 [Dokdonia sinensis]|uniref:Outer membrane protein beta-barrel domain-containing protein n=1 Tax=Dokdonia sinensis TaxID=2479847 RepID=A0A3M0FW70_9FLAO|nr:DUF6048 family protein [Dokdonia sinensis]RMB56217.1 hypothetical protein EAX61_15280 [Dokdonia sinensis]
MRPQHIFVFFISLYFGLYSCAVQAQDARPQDSIPTKTDYYGLRVGIDLSKLVRSGLDDDYTGFEVAGDFRITKKHYLAAEIGNEQRTTDLPNLNSTASGSYIKAGFNYNAYENWFGMNNLIYAGVRGGFSTFNQELNSYTIYTTNPLFGDDIRTDSREFNDLNATWLEFHLGVQVELFHNLYLGANVQLKRSITIKEPDGFEVLHIPGFGKTTDESAFAVGYGYSLSYLIPIFKK